MSSVYLITGVSSGLGLEITRDALAAGHKVIGTVLSRSKFASVVSDLEQSGASIIEFDASHPAHDVSAFARAAEAIYGRIDVLVNNGAYCLLGAVEDLAPADVQLQIQTNFFGPLFLIQALLPGMRTRASGTIVQISSVSGLDGTPASGLYAASKFALEGMSESLAREIAPFGLRVLLVEPGTFRTNILNAYITPGLSDPYKGGPVDDILKVINASNGKQPGDPVKGARMIVQTVDSGCKVGGQDILRLIIGPDSLDRVDNKLKSLTRDRAIAETNAKLASF